MRPTGWQAVLVRALVCVVFVAAFVLSFGSLYELAVGAHISPELAWLWPVSIDVLAVVSAVAARTLAGARRAALVAWSVLVFGLALSIWGNGLHSVAAGEAAATAPASEGAPAPGGSGLALTTRQAVVVSATPPISLALALHLLILMSRPVRDDGPGGAARTAGAGSSAAGPDPLVAPGASPPVHPGIPGQPPTGRAVLADLVAAHPDGATAPTSTLAAELAPRAGVTANTARKYIGEIRNGDGGAR